MQGRSKARVSAGRLVPLKLGGKTSAKRWSQQSLMVWVGYLHKMSSLGSDYEGDTSLRGSPQVSSTVFIAVHNLAWTKKLPKLPYLSKMWIKIPKFSQKGPMGHVEPPQAVVAHG